MKLRKELVEHPFSKIILLIPISSIVVICEHSTVIVVSFFMAKIEYCWTKLFEVTYTVVNAWILFQEDRIWSLDPKAWEFYQSNKHHFKLKSIAG